MSKKRHNFFRLCSLVLAFMLTFTNMPAVAYATDGYSAEALVEDTAEASENDTITEDGEIEESEPAVSDDELPAEDDAAELADDAGLVEEAGEEGELDGDMELLSDDYKLFDGDTPEEGETAGQYAITFWRDKTKSYQLAVVYANAGTHIDPTLIPEDTKTGNVFEGWTEILAGESQTGARFFTSEQIGAHPLDKNYDVYATFAPLVTPSFNPSVLNVTYGVDVEEPEISDIAPYTDVRYTIEEDQNQDVATVVNTGANAGQVTLIGSGSTVITAKVYSTNGAVTGTASYTLNVAKKAITLTANNNTGEYNGQAHEGAGIVTPATGVLAYTDAITASEISVADDGISAGEHAITINNVTIKRDNAQGVNVTSGYEITYAPGTLTVAPKAVNVTWDDEDSEHKIEFGTKKLPTVSTTDLVDPQTESLSVEAYRDQACTNIVDNIQLAGKGDYYAKVVLPSTNYTFANGTASVHKFTITKDTIIYTAVGFTGNYTGDAHSITVTVSDPAEGAVIKYRTEATGEYNLDTNPTFTEAGTHTVYFQISCEDYGTTEGSAQVIINPVVKTDMTVSLASWRYGDAGPHNPQITGGTGGQVHYFYREKVTAPEGEGEGEEEDPDAGFIPYDPNPATPLDAGEYELKAVADPHGNYLESKAYTEFEVHKGEAYTITTAPVLKTGPLTYTGEPQELLSTEGVSTGATVKYCVVLASATSTPTDLNQFAAGMPKRTDAGTYKVFYYIDGGKNYEPSAITQVSGTSTITINKAPRTGVTVSVAGWTYGSTPATPATTGTSESDIIAYLYSPDVAEWSAGTATWNAWSTVSSTLPAGTYHIKAIVGETANYTQTEFVGANTFTVAKKTVSVTWTEEDSSHVIKYADRKLPAISTEDLVGTDTLSEKAYEEEACTNLVTDITNAGKGDFWAKVELPSDNYVFATGTVEVHKFTIIKDQFVYDVYNATNADEEDIFADSIDYDGAPHGLKIVVKDKITGLAVENAVIKYYSTVSSDYTLDTLTYTDAGNCEFKFQITHPDYETVTATKSFTIARVVREDMTVSLPSWTYSSTVGHQPSVTNGTGGEVTYYYKAATADDNAYTQYPDTGIVNVGNYRLKAVAAPNGNYAETTAYVNFSVYKATASITTVPLLNSATLTYIKDTAQALLEVNGTPSVAETTIKYYVVEGDGADPTDLADFSATVPTRTDAGTYKVFYYIDGGNNYFNGPITQIVNGTQTTVTINKANRAAGSVSITASNWTYGASPIQPTVTYTGVNPEQGTATFKYYYDTDSTHTSTEMDWSTNTRDYPANNGTNKYHVYANIAATKNYNAFTTATVEYTVSPKALNVTANNYSMEYAGTEPSSMTATIDTTGLVGEDTIANVTWWGNSAYSIHVMNNTTDITSNLTTQNVGTYTTKVVWADGLTVTGNYSIGTVSTGTFTINKANYPAATVFFNDTYKAPEGVAVSYNGQNQNMIASVTSPAIIS